MDQQHQNYESFNDFGFVNAFAAGSENYAINQPPPHQSDMNSKGMSELGLPTLMSQGYDSRTIENSSLYDLSNPQYSQYHHPMASANAMEQHKLPPENYSIEPALTTTSVALPQDNVTKETSEQLPGTSKASSDTVSFDPSQNSMLKALGVVRKDVLGANSNKKRKRIVLLNDDDSDDASELKNEVFNQSRKVEESAAKKDEENVACEADNESDQDDQSDLTDIGALKAKFLLKNAVMIQGPDKRKKKSRLLDSDDEEQIHATSIDDIGMINENENENEEESFENDILITEPVMTIESVDISSKSEETCNQLVVAENQEPEEIMLQTPSLPRPIEEAPDLSKLETSESEQKDENVKANEEKHQSIEDNDIDPSMSVEAILENIKPMADDDEFFKFEKSSDENDKQIPNEEYFGSADKQMQGVYKGKKRGPKPGSKRIPKESPEAIAQRKKRGDRYEEDFVDDSDSGESSGSDYSESESSSDSSDVQEVKVEKRPRGRPPSVKTSPPAVLIQAKTFTVTKVPIRNNIIKRDRHFLPSRRIPNEIYFGDVNVPLHVLHTKWGSDAESDDDEDWRRSQMQRMSVQRSLHSSSSTKPPKHLRPQFTYIHDHSDEPKLSSLKEFIHLCGIKVNYQRLFDGIKSSDHKCALLRRIMVQKGMQGEPTVAKCKKIRRELQAKRESAELDKSVIITTEGRTRRSTRNASKSASYAEDSDNPPPPATVVQPETLQTLSKIRQFIDSDSE